VLGIATDLGSRTSHAAILARSLNIPAVLGLHDITAKSKPVSTFLSMGAMAG
jgi:Phosphoenolpyruvate-protein kinase (PTS system EI component in bacteria)